MAINLLSGAEDVSAGSQECMNGCFEEEWIVLTATLPLASKTEIDEVLDSLLKSEGILADIWSHEGKWAEFRATIIEVPPAGSLSNMVCTLVMSWWGTCSEGQTEIRAPMTFPSYMSPMNKKEQDCHVNSTSFFLLLVFPLIITCKTRVRSCTAQDYHALGSFLMLWNHNRECRYAFTAFFIIHN